MNLLEIPKAAKRMGLRYVLFRSKYEFIRRTGLLKRKYPTQLSAHAYITLEQWRGARPKYLFEDRSDIIVSEASDHLKSAANRVLRGDVLFFSSFWMERDKLDSWTKNPESGIDFGAGRHWTQIESYDPEKGDIKYVWEHARFSYLLDVMRYDAATKEDHSAFVFDEITDFIKNNPLNTGPNYVCSQEISIRILNWLFLLNFYKESTNLNEEKFSLIIRSIYGQLKHVYSNIDFSCIAVRNNHAITECSMLYIAGLLFPEFPESAKWKRIGLKRLIKEVEYQIYPDGTHLQYSTNYHRVVLQTLTYVLALMNANQQSVPKSLSRKYCKSIEFLFRCQDSKTGWLPNYGANDGALFFPLSDSDYRDYRPQLDAAYYLATGKKLYQDVFEERKWFCSSSKHFTNQFELKPQDGFFRFDDGGIYIIHDKGTMTFFKCTSYSKNRPSQADDLHLDIWVDGKNVLNDAGSYQYNTSTKDIIYFNGTESHNTVMLDDQSQMKKGPRFIWFDWTPEAHFKFEEQDDQLVLSGKILAFQSLGKSIFHERTVRKTKGTNTWKITDLIINKPEGSKMRQLWHTCNQICLSLCSPGNTKVEKDGFVSDYYGTKTKSLQIEFQTMDNKLETTVEIPL